MDLERTTVSSGSSSLWERIHQVSRQEGLRGITRRIGDRARRLLSIQYHYMLAYPLEWLDSAPPAKIPLQIEFISPEDGERIRELVQAYGVKTTEQSLLERMKQKEYCYAGRVDGRIVAYTWVLYGGDVKEYGNTLYRLRPDEVYLHDAYTAPEQRGKNICPAISTVIGRDMIARHSKTRMVKYVRRENTASLNVSRKMGEQHIGWVGWIKTLGRRHTFYIPIRPRRFK